MSSLNTRNTSGNNPPSTPTSKKVSSSNSGSSSNSKTSTPQSGSKPQPIPIKSNNPSDSSGSILATSGERKSRHSRQSSATLSPTSVFPPCNTRDLMPNPREVESRGRRSSSTSSSASAAQLRNSIYQPNRDGLSSSASSKVPPPPPPPSASSTADVFDQMEKEQEAIVNKLQREILELKTEQSRSRSQSTSSSASVSRNASIRSGYSVSDAEDMKPSNSTRISRASFSSNAGGPPAFDEQGLVSSLKKENEQLKKKLADLSIKLTEKDNEIEMLKHGQHNQG